MKAKLVYDGGDSVHIPEEMGVPRSDQMQGTPAEQLVELCGRVCYDSLGKGRPSFSKEEVVAVYPAGGGSPSQETKVLDGYHDHIRQTGHGSVLEHFNLTVEIGFDATTVGDNRKMLVAWQCMNRPGVIVMPTCGNIIRITANLRSIREWQKWTKSFYGSCEDQFGLDRMLASCLADHANVIAPNIIGPGEVPLQDMWPELAVAGLAEGYLSDHERWVSLYLVDSRGFSHEMVRHGDFTAISQRSTRYVDESESPWVEHPLLTAWMHSSDEASVYSAAINIQRNGEVWQEIAEGMSVADEPGSMRELVRLLLHGGCRGGVINDCRNLYDIIKYSLEQWLLSRGVDKTSARKQARGAARGYLGNALQTEMIFSASVAQWKWILRQRACAAADAEIREIACQMLGELKRSQYGDRFKNFQLTPSPDGIGQVAVELLSDPVGV